MISESATKIHGVSVRYQNGAKQLHKNGNQLPAVSQAQGLVDFFSFIKEVGSETRIKLLLLPATVIGSTSSFCYVR